MRDRLGRFSLVLNIVTAIVLVPTLALGVMHLQENRRIQDARPIDLELLAISNEQLNTTVRIVLVTVLLYIAIRTLTYILYGRFWH
jgi:hypothetical protein